MGAGSAAEGGAVSASVGTPFDAGDGVQEVAEGRGTAAVTNWLAIAMAASISRGEQVSPVAVSAPAGISEVGGGWAAPAPVGAPSAVPTRALGKMCIRDRS